MLEQSILRAAQARAQSPGASPKLFNIEKVADGIYAAIAVPTAQINCNAAIFENSDGLLIVDTHSKPSAVNALVAQIRKELTPKPVRYIVNSHFHWDHTQGNAGYRRLAPHADIIASEPTRRLIADLGIPRVKASLDEAAKSLDTWKTRLTAATAPEDKTYYKRMIAQTDAYLAEMKNYTPDLPNVTLERDLILHDKAHDLHLAFRGRGHTAGDVVVFCPQKKVVATGDMLHGFAPFLTDSYPLEWPRTLLTVAEFPFDNVIGGHGAVQHTRERLYQKASFIEELTRLVVDGKSTGRTLEQIATVDPAKLKSLTRDGYGQFLRDSMAKYSLVDPADRDTDPLPAAVKTCIGQIFTAVDQNV